MTAARLREAAKVLRERAKAATPGPWWNGVSLGNVVFSSTGLDDDIAVTEGFGKRADAAYIALVHPLVGLALADWLDDEACRIEMTGVRLFESPMRLADLILGTES